MVGDDAIDSLIARDLEGLSGDSFAAVAVGIATENGAHLVKRFGANLLSVIEAIAGSTRSSRSALATSPSASRRPRFQAARPSASSSRASSREGQLAILCTSSTSRRRACTSTTPRSCVLCCTPSPTAATPWSSSSNTSKCASRTTGVDVLGKRENARHAIPLSLEEG
jgi:hypothetical protein